VAVFAIGMILAGDLRSGKTFESVNVAWAHDAEVPAVQGGNFGRAQSLGGGDHPGVDGPEREVHVGLDEITGAPEFCLADMFDIELARGQAAEEPCFDTRSRASCQQAGHFCYHEIRNHQWFSDLFEKGCACRMVRVVAKGGSNQWPGIDNDGSQGNPSASISSSACLAENPGFA
jgi:hypothetical protein